MSVILIAHRILGDVGHMLEEAGFHCNLTDEEKEKLIKEAGETYFSFSDGDK